ncbi:MAG TPA: WD40 repeat domain-containing protein, partial [Mycobacterium sp.]|nr:WD40 repeat domain-containing protein [Mycobacterium sp.]
EVATIPAQGENGLVRSLAFNPAEDAQDLVAFGGNNKTVTLWDTKNGRKVTDYPVGAGVTSVAFSRTGDRVVVGRLDGTIEILNGRTLAPLGGQFLADPGVVHAAAFSPDGARIVSGGDDNTVKVWDAFSQAPIGKPLRGHHGAVSAVAFNNTGTHIVSSSLDGSVYLWDAVFGLSVPAGQGKAVRAVAFSNSDSRRMASGGSDGTVKLWDTKTATLAGTLGQPSPDGERAINSLAFNHDGSRIVTAGKDGRVILWDVATSRPIVELPKTDPLGGAPFADTRMQSVAFSPDGKRIVAGGMDGVVRLWDAAPPYSSTAVTAHKADGLPYQVWSVAFSPNGRKVVSGSGFDRAGNPNNLIQLWNVDTLTADGDPIEGEPGFNVYSVGFDHTGDLVFSGSFTGTARVWDVTTRKEAAKPLSGDQNPVLSVAFAHSHQWIATGGGSGTVRLWDLINRPPPANTPLEGHQNWVHSVAFSPDDSLILSGSADGNLRLWPAPQDVGEVICSKLTTNMSPKQWSDWVSPKIAYKELCPGKPRAPDA